jgi:hypothetical protein
MVTVTSRPSLESREDRQVAQQLEETEARLVESYRGQDGVTEERVRSAFGAVKARFEHARVRNFLPILIERGVRVELGR